MRTKRHLTAFAAVGTAVALLLATPTAASAVPFTPDGSVPYGPDTICSFEGSSEFADPLVDATCSTIPSFEWGTEAIPAPTTDYLTNAQLNGLDWVAFVNNEGGWTEASQPGTNAANFYVNPSNPAALPLITSANLSVFGHNTETTEITNVSAYFVADSSVVAAAEPYTGETGERSTVITDGTAVPATLTSTGDGSYDVTLNIPTATWTYSTDGVLNGYGWSGRVVIVVEGTSNGEAVTQVTQSGFNFYSQYLYDIAQFFVEPPLNAGEVGVAGSGYAINGSSSVIAPPVVTPPVVEPPVVEPPVVTPPAVETPTPQPEPTPDGPRVDAGADGPLASWLPLALLAGGVVGLFPLLFTLRRRERAEQ